MELSNPEREVEALEKWKGDDGGSLSDKGEVETTIIALVTTECFSQGGQGGVAGERRGKCSQGDQVQRVMALDSRVSHCCVPGQVPSTL